MPRDLAEFRPEDSDASAGSRDLGVTRRTSRSLAAAVAVLLLATIVVNRSSSALNPDSASAASQINSGTIDLTDDDAGRSLFKLDDLSPARPVSRCITVTYGGTVLPVDLFAKAEAGGPLADHLAMTLEVGTGGDVGSCDGFVAEETLVDEGLSEFVDRGWFDIGGFVNSGESRSFRITLLVDDDQDALGLTTSLVYTWEVTPS